jgi:hypothetical protein
MEVLGAVDRSKGVDTFSVGALSILDDEKHYREHYRQAPSSNVNYAPHPGSHDGLCHEDDARSRCGGLEINASRLERSQA